MLLTPMKFSRKIFLALFGTASFAAVAICLILYGSISRYRSEDFADSYVDHMNLLAKALNFMELSESRIALNAAKALQMKDQKASLKENELDFLAKEFGVNEVRLHPDLKALSAAFPEMNLDQTPIFQSGLEKGADARIGLHTVWKSHIQNKFVEVEIYFDDLTRLLREMAQHDEDNLAVEIIDSDNQSLGRIHRNEFTEVLDLEKTLKLSDGAHWQKDQMLVLTTIKSKLPTNYRLVATISTRALVKELHKIQLILISVAVALIVISWLLSKVLTKTLLRKVESIRSLLRNITRSQDYSQRVVVSEQTESQDELDDLGKNLNQMLSTLQASQSQLLEAERDKARSQIAAQVAHDIRSPLMSMNMALSQLEGSQLEPLSLLKSAVARVAGIVQKLSASSAKSDEGPQVESPKLTLVEPLIASVFNEHQVRKQVSQKLSLHGLSHLPHVWCVLQVSEFQTALSNLINNAFEAGASEVALNLSEENKEWKLSIQDNGKGIPVGIIEKIFERSFTHGKKTGTGLGLFQAKSAIEWSGGNLTVTSEENKGTCFTIVMPKEKKPSWLPESLEVGKEQLICFVDDDQQILSTWKEKSDSLGLKSTRYMSSIQEFKKEFPSNTFPSDALIVIDQNLKDTKTGLELLAELAIGRRATLCTSEFDEKGIQDQVKKLKANLIPKPWISQFEIKVRTS